ncbi:MAG: glycosyl transferase [Microbacterium gubbeenense]|uniref:glycosyl transferase n=1 Tax=Microbacterium gubbeenense TaxID=159896 RepID=UPI003F98B6DB
MRFVWAVVAFLAGVGLIGAGVVQLDDAKSADEITSQIEAPDQSLPYTVIDAEVLSAYPGQQGLKITGTDEEIFASYGRTSDIQAWLSDTTYNHATLAGTTSESGEPRVESDVVEPTNDYADTGERVWWNPRDSDLWIEQMVADDELDHTFALPEGMSLLIATDGTAPAPSDVSVTWTTAPVTTPWAGPLIAAGGLALLIGIVLWILGFIHMRRRRGPRRKGSKASAGSNRRGSGRKQITGTAESRRAPGARRALVGIPALAVGGALLAGCTPSAWPEFGADPTPTPTPEATESAETEMPALTDAQAQRLVSSMATVMDDADREGNAELGEKRLSGVALDVRKIAYEIRADVEDWTIPTPLPDGEVSVLLPQANDGWPRTALLVIGDEESEKNPTILIATQSSPWETYKMSYMGSITPSTEIPELAPAWLGAALVPPDSSFLQIAPDELAAAYADVIDQGEDSEYAELFDVGNDPFIAALTDKRAQTKDTFEETAKDTAEITFDQQAGSSDPVALATFNSGAIVAVSLGDSETLKPTDEDGVIKIPDAPEIQHFVGEDETTTGLTTSYTSQLFFSVPAKASDEPIRVLGYSYALTGSELLPEPEDEEE